MNYKGDFTLMHRLITLELLHSSVLRIMFTIKRDMRQTIPLLSMIGRIESEQTKSTLPFDLCCMVLDFLGENPNKIELYLKSKESEQTSCILDLDSLGNNPDRIELYFNTLRAYLLSKELNDANSNTIAEFKSSSMFRDASQWYYREIHRNFQVHKNNINAYLHAYRAHGKYTPKLLPFLKPELPYLRPEDNAFQIVKYKPQSYKNKI